ncbi:MAG: DNRLRE domain-containing protein [Chloroflexi bacterium]|nr:MAG: DNRLRE domain-containing protein [Chloroflexota bacterium]
MSKPNCAAPAVLCFLVVLLLVFGAFSRVVAASINREADIIGSAASDCPPDGSCEVYLPLVSLHSNSGPLPTIHIPYFDGEISYPETAVFWFGKVNLTENYADVRAGYSSDELYINLGIFDRRIWYNKFPTLSELSSWDAVSIYLDTQGLKGSKPSESSYLIQGQFGTTGPRASYQAAYRGTGTGWAASIVPFTSTTGYRGDGPNNQGNDAGWEIVFHIPFSSLGLDGPPHSDSWAMAVVLHDRDDIALPPEAEKMWPTGISQTSPVTWGEITFGLPSIAAPGINPGGTTIIRQGLNGATVKDGMAGGFANCGSGLNRWTAWGEANYAASHQVNVQNQRDVADFPCFSKYFIDIPLEAIPSGAQIISAELTLNLFSNAGEGEYTTPGPSLIQAFTILGDWDESTLNWNNAPQVLENLSSTWVDPILTEVPPPPGIANTWNVSKAAMEARSRGMPLRLALYSADSQQHSGKYFYASDTGDWNAAGRPTLTVVWGYP